jgi:hypothetical protein
MTRSSSAVCVSLLLAAAACAHAPSLPPGSAFTVIPLVQSLLTPNRRDAAACALLERGPYAVPRPPYQEPVPGGGCHVRNVLRGHPGDPRSLCIVLLESCADDPETPPTPTTGHLVLFDAGGRIVPVFAAADYLSQTDAVFAYRPDGSLAVAHLIPYGPSGSAWAVQILHIVPATALQKPILNVIVGPPGHGIGSEFTWTWRLQDVDGDGSPEVEIGPAHADGTLEPKAFFRYSSLTASYKGPAGALDGDWWQFAGAEKSRPYEVAERFTAAHPN